jgi:2-dehydropantoate 2-reductase
MRTALVGTGSLGTIMGALLSKAGVDIVLVDANLEHVKALNCRGAQVVGCMDFTTPVRAIVPAEMEGIYGLVIYLVKGTYDEAALPQVRSHLGIGSTLITLQNGVPEDKVASFVGRERTVGGAVGWGAAWLRPGVSELLTSEPEKMTYDIGEMDGAITSRIKMVKEVLDHAGHAKITENLVGVRWTKLLINVSMSGLSTVLGCTYGDVIDDDKALTAGVLIILETIKTAKALGVMLEPMQGVDPTMLLDIVKESLEDAKNVVRLVIDPHRSIKASMLQDLEKGLPCEIEALNGYLSRVAARSGISTPVNDQVTRIIRAIQAGKMSSKFSNLEGIQLPQLSAYF